VATQLVDVPPEQATELPQQALFEGDATLIRSEEKIPKLTQILGDAFRLSARGCAEAGGSVVAEPHLGRIVSCSGSIPGGMKMKLGCSRSDPVTLLAVYRSGAESGRSQARSGTVALERGGVGAVAAQAAALRLRRAQLGAAAAPSR